MYKGFRPEIRAEYEHIETYRRVDARRIIKMIEEEGVESAVDHMARAHVEGTHPIVEEHERIGEVHWCMDYVVTIDEENELIEFEYRIDSV